MSMNLYRLDITGVSCRYVVRVSCVYDLTIVRADTNGKWAFIHLFVIVSVQYLKLKQVYKALPPPKILL